MSSDEDVPMTDNLAYVLHESIQGHSTQLTGPSPALTANHLSNTTNTTSDLEYI